MTSEIKKLNKEITVLKAKVKEITLQKEVFESMSKYFLKRWLAETKYN